MRLAREKEVFILDLYKQATTNRTICLNKLVGVRYVAVYNTTRIITPLSRVSSREGIIIIRIGKLKSRLFNIIRMCSHLDPVEVCK